MMATGVMVTKRVGRKPQKRERSTGARKEARQEAVKRAADIIIDIYRPALKELEKH